MVKHAENVFESIVNKLVLLSLLGIIAILFMDIMLYFDFFHTNFIEPYTNTIDYVINSVFIVDLILIFRKRTSIRMFLWKNWLDIIACIPLNNIFRAAKLVRLSRIAKLTARQGKVARVLPKAARLKQLSWLRGLKVFSKETEVDKHIDYTKAKIEHLKLSKLDHELNKIYKILMENDF